MLHVIPSIFFDAATKGRAAWDCAQRVNFCDTNLQAEIARCRRYRTIPLTVVSVLISFCVPLTICGCLGGQIISPNTPAGSLQASPNNISFGSVPVGSSASTSVSVMNEGTAAVNVSQLSLSGQSFAVSGASNLPMKVAPGQTLSFNVSFSPAAAGTTAGQVTIASDAATNGTLVVGLNGTGAAVSMASAPQLSSMNCAANSVTGSANDSCTVTLSAAAPSGGFTVSLASNNPAAIVPASITVGAGLITGSFAANVSAVTSAQTATLTASAGTAVETFALQLNAVGPIGPAPAVLSKLACLNSSMTGTGIDNCTVSLNAPAGDGGVAVNIASDNSAVTVPNSVTVAAGTTSATFNADIAAVSTPQMATLTASEGGVTEPFELQLNASASGQAGAATTALSGLSCTVGSMTGAGTDACMVTLTSAAPSGGYNVSLASNNAAVAVPATVRVPAGASSANFTATVVSVSTAQVATLTASASGGVEQFSLQLNVGTGGLSINSTSIAFGNVPVNTTVTQSLELTTSGLLPIVVAAVSVQGSGFSVKGATFPLTLAVGQPLTLDVTFDPTAAGASTGQLVIASAALTGADTVVALSGTGVITGPDQVNLTWDAPSNSSDPVAGYNVYRAASGGTNYQQLNGSAIPASQTSYVDVAVVSGQTYDYIVESVDAQGVTSAPSNIASLEIP